MTGRKRQRPNFERVFKGTNLNEEIKKFLTDQGGVSEDLILNEQDEIKSRSV